MTEIISEENLSWKSHLMESSKKLARTCGVIISKVKSLFSPDVLLCLYNSLFMSFAQYGAIVWGNTSASYIDSVYKLQKTLVRIIFSHPTRTPYALIFKSLELLSDVFQLELLIFDFA